MKLFRILPVVALFVGLAEPPTRAGVERSDPGKAGVTWAERQTLNASNQGTNDHFGASLDVAGDTLVFGAPEEDTNGNNAGAAYVFVSSGGTWSEQQLLVASDGAPFEGFGTDVAVFGDLLAVGSPYDDTSGGYHVGSAYVFLQSGGVWTQEQKLTAPDGANDWAFGYSLALSGDTLAIGAPYAAVNTGAIYIFVRSGTTWTLQQKVVPFDGEVGDFFGQAVSLSGDTLVTGSEGDDDLGDWAGAGYVYVRSGGVWSLQQKLLASDGSAGSWLGTACDVSDDTLVLGADGVKTAGYASGAAYVFERSGTTWTESKKLLPGDLAGGDHFGFSVAASPDAALVGAYAKGVAMSATGSAYVFRRGPGTWLEEATLLGSTTSSGDYYGWAVGLSTSTAVVSATRDDPFYSDAGTAYVFRPCSAQAPAEVVRLGTPPNPNALHPGLTSPPVIGATWDPWVDHSVFMPAASIDLLAVALLPSNTPLPGIGTLLCDLSTTLLVLQSPAGIPFSLPVPLDCSFIGLQVVGQGASLDLSGASLVTNALDLVVGNY